MKISFAKFFNSLSLCNTLEPSTYPSPPQLLPWRHTCPSPSLSSAFVLSFQLISRSSIPKECPKSKGADILFPFPFPFLLPSLVLESLFVSILLLKNIRNKGSCAYGVESQTLTVGVHSKGFICRRQARRARQLILRDPPDGFQGFKKWCEGKGWKAAQAAGGPSSDGLLWGNGVMFQPVWVLHAAVSVWSPSSPGWGS